MQNPQDDSLTEEDRARLWPGWKVWSQPRRGLRAVVSALGVKRAQWRGEDKLTESADAEFRKVRDAALADQEHTCMFCGFRAESGIEAHHLDDNHRNNDKRNLGAADVFCHGDHHIGQVGANREGVLVVIPLTIEDLNHLQRTINVALVSDDETTRDRASRALKYLLSKRKGIETAWGSSDPSIWAEALLSLNEAQYDRRSDVMQGIGLVFHPKRISRYAQMWLKSEYAALPFQYWKKIHARYSS